MLTSLLGEPVYIRFNSIMIGLFEVRFLICISAHGSSMGFWVGARRAGWIHLTPLEPNLVHTCVGMLITLFDSKVGNGGAGAEYGTETARSCNYDLPQLREISRVI